MDENRKALNPPNNDLLMHSTACCGHFAFSFPFGRFCLFFWPNIGAEGPLRARTSFKPSFHFVGAYPLSFDGQAAEGRSQWPSWYGMPSFSRSERCDDHERRPCRGFRAFAPLGHLRIYEPDELWDRSPQQRLGSAWLRFFPFSARHPFFFAGAFCLFPPVFPHILGPLK
jgi:hypothetical protein